MAGVEQGAARERNLLAGGQFPIGALRVQPLLACRINSAFECVNVSDIERLPRSGNYDTVTLTCGDSAYFDASVGHRL